MKRVLITVDFNILKQHVKTGNELSAIVRQGIPEDAKLIDVFLDKYRVDNRIRILIESESLEDVPEGNEYPDLDITFENIFISIER